MVPGPGGGPFTKYMAERVATVIRSIIVYATAAPIETFPSLFPLRPEAVTEAQQHATDSSVGELTVDGVLFYEAIASLAVGSNREALRRIQEALFAYEQAISQASEYVAIVLFVSAIEALAVPNVAWDQDRVTSRFVQFVEQAAFGTGLFSSIMDHSNFRQVFGNISSPKRFLNDLYAARSKPLHTGFVQHGGFQMSAWEPSMRVALVSDLVRGVIRSFLTAPFSSLVGHPMIAPRSE